MLTIIGFLLFLLRPAIAQDECKQQGQCINSYYLDTKRTSNQIDCSELCKSNEDCNWFTYVSSNQHCFLYANCYQVSKSACPDDCLTSQRNCQVETLCPVQGKCIGNIYQFHLNASQELCFSICRTSRGNCEWISYNAEKSLCLLLKDCHEFDESDTVFVSESKTCVKGKQIL